MPHAEIATYVILRAGSKSCAVPIEDVAEVMRPLPATPVPGMPPYMSGLAIIRGAPTPVLDLDRLLQEPSGPKDRFVSLKTGSRPVALAVGEVAGVERLDGARLRELPALLDAADGAWAEAMAQRAGELLVVLAASRLLPAGEWALPTEIRSP